MMLTAIKCKEENITFAAVHDSYWCHPSDIDRMNAILREQFVKLHGSPLIENLRENFESRYPKERFPTVPKQGTFDLENVKESTYFFS
jgi:DNA-directed RNA polymerase